MSNTDYADRGEAPSNEIHLPICTPCLARSLSIDGGSYVSPQFWADRAAPCTCEDLPIGVWCLIGTNNEVDRTMPGYSNARELEVAHPGARYGLVARTVTVCAEYDDCSCQGTEHEGIEV